MARLHVLPLVMLLSCTPKIEVSVLPLVGVEDNPVIQSSHGPEITALDVVVTGADFTFSAVNKRGDPSSPGIGVPFRFDLALEPEMEAEPYLLEVRGFAGEHEVFRGQTDVLPGQKRATIRVAVCSNGAPEAAEACDDGDLEDGDGCDSTCKPTGCGSGVLTPRELCYEQNNSVFADGSPRQVLAGDFDGDELPDLAAVFAGAVRLYPNPAEDPGNFGAFLEVAVPGAEKAAAADIDGDGDRDLVVAASPFSFSELVVLVNEGGGVFAARDGGFLGGDVRGFALGDIDGDDLPDLVYADAENNSVRVRPGLAGAFNGISMTIPVGVRPVALALGDVAGDGALDVVVANEGSGSITVLENRGGDLVSLFSRAVNGTPSAVVVKDVNRDGLLDISVAKQDAQGGWVSVFQREEEGGLRFIADFPTGDSPSALAVADLDQDGLPDLATTSFTAARIDVLLGLGNTQFDAPRDLESDLSTRLSPVSIAVADFNGDGALDLCVAGQNLGLMLSNP
jgi:cysteine-rich repeat protein